MSTTQKTLANGAIIGADCSYLIRIESRGSFGWQLRFPKWYKGASGSIMFADNQYGGPKASFAAALASRDVYFENLPLHPSAYQSNKRSSSGIAGVNLNFSPKLKGASAFAWVACWMEDGKQHKLRFGIGLSGSFENALDMAIATREQNAGVIISEEQRAQALSLKQYVTDWEEKGIAPDYKPQRKQTGSTFNTNSGRAEQAQLAMEATMALESGQQPHAVNELAASAQVV